MNIAVLGGGRLGRVTAGVLSNLPDIDGLTIIDHDSETARTTAAAVGPAARPLTLDVASGAPLVDALTSHTTVVNAVGPTIDFAPHLLDAAIGAGCHYVDATDDLATTMAMAQRNGAARRAAVTAVVGAGMSPGLTNLLATMATRELARVDHLVTGWGYDAGEGYPRVGNAVELDRRPTTLARSMASLIGDDVTFTAGSEPQTLSTLAPVAITFPETGTGTGWTTGRPETLTLAANLDIAGRVDSVMLTRRRTASLFASYRNGINSGALDRSWLPVLLADPPLRRRIGAMFGAIFRPGATAIPAVFALATGQRSDGSGLRVGVSLPGLEAGLHEIAGTVLAHVAHLVSGGSNAPGIQTIEELEQPRSLLDRIVAQLTGPSAVQGNPVHIANEPL